MRMFSCSPAALLLGVFTVGAGLWGCAGDKSDEGTEETGGADGGDGTDGTDGESTDGADGGGTDAPCPDTVPEEYRYLWDCEANSCDGNPILYNYGVGSSTADGGFSAEEKWYIFGGGTECMDVFTIEGDWSEIDPVNFRCSECEEIFQVTWELTSGNTCGLVWGSLFVDDRDDAEGPFSGFLLFDTHNAFEDRNEDNAALVIGAPGKGGTYYPNPNYGRGEAVPEAADQPIGPPESYEWTGPGTCLSLGKMRGAGPVERPEESPVDFEPEVSL